MVRRERGFSLLEVMVVLLILTIMSGAIFRSINTVQQRNAVEQTRLDLFQEAREFMDQMSRDLHQAGYPNPRNFTVNYLSGTSDYRGAVGLVKIDSGELWFEGDVDGSGTVSSVQYHYSTSGTGCSPACLQRSQVPKTSVDPLSQGTNFQTEVQYVQNGTSSSPIFYAYRADGTQVTLPVDIDNNPTDIANINTIKVVLTAQSRYADPQTKAYPITTLVSTVKLNNCSQGTSGMAMSCQ